MSLNYYHRGRNEKKVLLSPALSPSLAVNGSGTAVAFSYAPPAGFIYEIASFQIILADNANLGSIGNFFTLNNPLTNGLLVERIQDGVTILSVNIISNLDLLTYGTTNFEERTLSTDSVLIVETEPLTRLNAILDGDKGDIARITVRDDFSVFTAGRAIIAGAIIEK